MELCNRLEANLEDGDDGRGRLVGALLHETLKQDGGPALVGRPSVRLEWIADSPRNVNYG